MVADTKRSLGAKFCPNTPAPAAQRRSILKIVMNDGGLMHQLARYRQADAMLGVHTEGLAALCGKARAPGFAATCQMIGSRVTEQTTDPDRVVQDRSDLGGI
jgi:hypothetical protein